MGRMVGESLSTNVRESVRNSNVSTTVESSVIVESRPPEVQNKKKRGLGLDRIARGKTAREFTEDECP